MNALNKKTLFTYFKEGGIYVVLLVLLAIIIIQDPTFLSLMNLSNILTQSSVRIIIALGVAGLIVTQGTDLSAGRQVGLAAVVAATLLQSMDNVNKVFPHMETWSIPLVILLVCAVGAVIGLVNGLIIAYPRVEPQRADQQGDARAGAAGGGGSGLSPQRQCAGAGDPKQRYPGRGGDGRLRSVLRRAGESG